MTEERKGKKPRKYTWYFCLSILPLLTMPVLFDLRVPLLHRLVSLRDPHPSHPWLVPLVVSRGFIRWRKECASFGLVISSRWPAEREERIAYATETPWSNFSNSLARAKL